MTTDPLTRLRDEFPVSEKLIYLNHAAVSPLARRTAEAMRRQVDDVHAWGAWHWRDWEAELDRTRAAAAGLIGAAPDEIALVKNTSEALSAAALGIDWRPGDRMVGFACEFPANLYPWLALRSRGVKVELLPATALADPDRLRAACRGARLLSLSFVQYDSGFRADLATCGAICREAGAWFVVDAIQGLGAFPLDVGAAGIDVLAADGHKWLTGPEGAGLFYVRRDRLDELTPRVVGWLSAAPWADFGAAQRMAANGSDIPWRAGARRYECGTLNTAGFYGLGAAIGLLRETGIETIGQRILSLTAHLAQRLEEMGAELLRPGAAALREEHRSGIVSFRLPGAPSPALAARLLEAGVCCALRGDFIRLAPHGYNTLDEMERFATLVNSRGVLKF